MGSEVETIAVQAQRGAAPLPPSHPTLQIKLPTRLQGGCRWTCLLACRILQILDAESGAAHLRRTDQASSGNERRAPAPKGSDLGCFEDLQRGDSEQCSGSGTLFSRNTLRAVDHTLNVSRALLHCRSVTSGDPGPCSFSSPLLAGWHRWRAEQGKPPQDDAKAKYSSDI